MGAFWASSVFLMCFLGQTWKSFPLYRGGAEAQCTWVTQEGAGGGPSSESRSPGSQLRALPSPTLTGPRQAPGRASRPGACSPRPASPLLPGKHGPHPLPDSLVAQLVGRSQAWQPLVGVQVELLFPAPSLARSMASSSKYVLPDRPQLLAGGALGGLRELGANWAQPA